jgi:hypothetical protein
MEKLNMNNVIEIQLIKNLLEKYNPSLLQTLDLLISVANSEINEERAVKKLVEEEYVDPLLSDHSSDED